MNVLDRYIIREFLKVLAFGIISLILVSTVVDLFERVNDIAEFKPPITVAVMFFLARMPQVLFMVVPISMLLSTLLVIGALARNSEVIAMLASGVSIYRMLLPLFVIGLVMSLLMFGLNEFVVPTANIVAAQNKRIMRGRPDNRNQPKIQVWVRGTEEKRIYYMDVLIPETREARVLTIFELNDQFLPVKRLDAQRAVYHLPKPPAAQSRQSWGANTAAFFSGLFTRVVEFFHPSEKKAEEAKPELGTWTIYQGSERSLEASASRTIFHFEERRDYVIPRSFYEFWQESKDPEDMNFRELGKYMETLTAAGYDVSKYVVDLYGKVAYPFVSVVMVIIGFPFALQSPRSGAAVGVGISVFIGLAYWIILQLGISLGHAGIFPPLVAVLISHLIFASAGFYLILSTRT